MDSRRGKIKREIENWFRDHTDEMLEDLRKMIAVKSVREPAEKGAPYGKGSREALDLAIAMLENRGFQVDIFEDMIITSDYGPSPPKLGLLVHLDVVDPGEGWATDPYEMTIKDGKVYGRGATDNKGPSIASMYAVYCVRELYPELQNAVRLILGSGEECGCEDIEQYLAKNETPPYVFAPDADYPLVNTEKGRVILSFKASFDAASSLPRVISLNGGKTINIVPNCAEAVVEGFLIGEVESFCKDYGAKTGAKFTARQDGGKVIITAEGKSSHAALPWNGVNAQTAMLEMLSAMPFADVKSFKYIKDLNKLFPHGDYYGRSVGVAMHDDISGDLTLSFNVLRLTEYELAGNFDCRSSVCADKVDIYGILRRALETEGFEITYHDVKGSHHTSQDSPFVQSLLRIYEEYTGNERRCLSMGGQTYVHGIPGGVAFGCELPGANSNIHGVDEFNELENLIVSARMFAHAIVDICGTGAEE